MDAIWGMFSAPPAPLDPPDQNSQPGRRPAGPLIEFLGPAEDFDQATRSFDQAMGSPGIRPESGADHQAYAYIYWILTAPYPMDSYGFLWIPMDSYGFYGFLWSKMST